MNPLLVAPPSGIGSATDIDAKASGTATPGTGAGAEGSVGVDKSATATFQVAVIDEDAHTRYMAWLQCVEKYPDRNEEQLKALKDQIKAIRSMKATDAAELLNLVAVGSEQQRKLIEQQADVLAKIYADKYTSEEVRTAVAEAFKGWNERLNSRDKLIADRLAMLETRLSRIEAAFCEHVYKADWCNTIADTAIADADVEALLATFPASL